MQNFTEEILNIKSQLKVLENELAHQKKLNEFLKKRIERLENNSGISQAEKDFEKNDEPKIFEQKNFQSPSAKVETKIPTLKSIINEFNSLSEQTGFELKNLRDKFVQDYKVRAFNCTNFEARMNEPIPPPEFREVEIVLSGDYWAINLKSNLFAVFPNVRIYSDNYHEARAMGGVFQSNFRQGENYNKIFVTKPAIFECSGNIWRLTSKGNLNLR